MTKISGNLINYISEYWQTLKQAAGRQWWEDGQNKTRLRFQGLFK